MDKPPPDTNCRIRWSFAWESPWSWETKQERPRQRAHKNIFKKNALKHLGIYVCLLLTLGAQVMCMPGTGSVVMYIVTQRYKYRVPMRKKNRLLAIDLKSHILGLFRLTKCVKAIQIWYEWKHHSFSMTQESHEKFDRLSPGFTDEAVNSKKCFLLVSEEEQLD